MSLAENARLASAGLIERARDAGLPVERAESFFADRVEPWLIRALSAQVIPFVRRTGVRVVELQRGRVVCRMPLKGNVNHIGTMYAGALFTLAEFPGGPLMLATFGLRRYVPIVTALDLEFVKVAKGPVTIELTLSEDEIAAMERDVERDGKALFELRGELRNEAGDVVARSRASYQMRPRR